MKLLSSQFGNYTVAVIIALSGSSYKSLVDAQNVLCSSLTMPHSSVGHSVSPVTVAIKLATYAGLADSSQASVKVRQGSLGSLRDNSLEAARGRLVGLLLIINGTK